jgi:amino acid transporter
MSMDPSSPATDPSAVGLRPKSVGLGGDWIMSITNVAPTAATTLTMGALIGAAGLGAPLALLIAGAAMLCCAVAYHRLNRWEASAASPVRWVAHGLSPVVGFGVGILVLMTALTSNIGNITLLGSTVLSLVAPSQINNKPLTFVVAVVVCAIVVTIAVLGVRATIRFQGWIVLGEYVIIGTLAIWGLVTELTSHAVGITAPSWSWFSSIHSVGGTTGLLSGAVIATFLLGGWDAPIYLGDEQHRAADPGRSVMISIAFCTLWVTFLFVCLQGLAPTSAISAHASNVLPFLGSKLAGTWFVDLVALAVISSFATTTQSQIVDGSRIMFGMAREKILPHGLRSVHPKFRTPIMGLCIMGGIPVVALALYLASSSLRTTIGYIDSTGGLLFAGYYIVVALFSIWYYRSVVLRDAKEFLLGLVIPLVGAATLSYVIYRSIPGTPGAVLVIAICLFLVGIPMALISKAVTRSDFFKIKRERFEDTVDAPSAVVEDEPVSGSSE